MPNGVCVCVCPSRTSSNKSAARTEEVLVVCVSEIAVIFLAIQMKYFSTTIWNSRAKAFRADREKISIDHDHTCARYMFAIAPSNIAKDQFLPCTINDPVEPREEEFIVRNKTEKFFLSLFVNIPIEQPANVKVGI